MTRSELRAQRQLAVTDPNEIGSPLSRLGNKPRNTKILERLEAQVGGPVAMAFMLTAGGGSPQILKLAEELASETGQKKGLTRIAAAMQLDAATVLAAYTRGLVQTTQIKTIGAVAQHLPKVGRQLVKEALPQRVSCRTCSGQKVVVRKGEEVACPSCAGEGATETLGPHFEYASKQLMEMVGLGAKGSQVNVAVNTQVNNNLNMGAELLERLTSVSDAIVHQTKDAVEAEVLSVESA